MKFIIISALLSSLAIAVMIWWVIHRKINPLWFIPTIILMYFMYSRGNGKEMTDHGLYNKIIVSIMILVEVILYYLTKLTIYLVMKFKFMLIFFALFGIWYSFRVHNSWEGWELGIGDSKILNGNGETRLDNPNYWELGIRHGLVDIFTLLGSWKDQPMTVRSKFLNKKLKETK